MKAIVLSGGGAKGAYQAGVWQALRKLRIKYDIVTGTSIGALNGMFMVQKDFNKCLYLWKNINFDQIYNDFKANNKKEIYKSYFDSIIKGGISTLKIEQLIANNYNPKKLYNSKIKYGVVTYNVSNLSVYYATNENTKAEQLKNYIMASATCFPVFKPKKIDNDTYIDGGFYDNLPLNLAIDLGATQIIAVDLDAVGIKKRVKNREVKITSIRPTNKLESFLMFDKNVTKKMIKFGYNDTLKAFNKLEGHTYTFKKGFLNNNYKKHHLKFVALTRQYIEKGIGDIRKVLNDKDTNLVMNKIIEEALEIFRIDASKIYSSNFNKELLLAFDKIEATNILDIEEIKSRRKRIKFIYKEAKQMQSFNYAICNLFPKEVLIAIYILTITKGNTDEKKYINRY